MPKTIGVIGLGSIGMRHAKNLRELGHHVWGFDPDRSRALKLGFDYCADKITHMQNADGFVVAAPTEEHANLYTKIHEYGKPVFMEKPIFGRTSVIEPTQIVMVGYNLRFHECVQKAKKWLPEIGKPHWGWFACGQYNDKPAYLRDGVILNWSHEIDLALHLMGPGEVLTSSTRVVDGHDDMTDIILAHSDARSHIHLDYVTKFEHRGFVICGENGNIRANLVERTVVLSTADNTSMWVGKGSFDQDYKTEMQAFIDRIDGKETPGATAQEATDVLKICLGVRKQAGLS